MFQTQLQQSRMVEVEAEVHQDYLHGNALAFFAT